MIFKNRVIYLLDRLNLLDLARAVNNKRYIFSLKRIYPKIKETGEIPLPDSFVYEPTNKCNLNCKMCFFNKDYKKDYTNELSLNEIKNIFNKINVEKIILTGGECFMRKDFFDLLNFFEQKGILVHLTTNGTMINKENVEKLVKNKSIIHIGISIDGDEKMHNSIRMSDIAFSKAVNGLNLIKNKFPSNIICVITKENFDLLENVVELAREIGVKEVHFEYERRYTDNEINGAINLLNISRKDIPLSKRDNCIPNYNLDDLKNKLDKIEKLGKKYKIKINYFPSYLKSEANDCYNRIRRNNGKYICMALFTGRIDSKGNIIPCFGIRKSFGNLREKSFEEIWNCEEFKEFRKKLLNNNLMPMCETCLYMQRIK